MIYNYNQFINENVSNNLDVYDIAWFYFIAVIYDNKMNAKDSWKNDNRMNKHMLSDTMDVAIKKELAIEQDGYYSLTKDGIKLLEKTFYRKSIDDVIKLAYELPKKGDSVYDISNIPLRYWLYKNPRTETNISKINDILTDWYNRVLEIYLTKLEGNKYLDIFNKINIYKKFYPEPIPEEITIYRGIKSEYIKPTTKYTSWSLKKDEAIRFATYHLVKNSYSKPRFSEVGYILELKVKLSDIFVFYLSGGEDEIIIDNAKINDRDIIITKII